MTYIVAVIIFYHFYLKNRREAFPNFAPVEMFTQSGMSTL